MAFEREGRGEGRELNGKQLASVDVTRLWLLTRRLYDNVNMPMFRRKNVPQLL